MAASGDVEGDADHRRGGHTAVRAGNRDGVTDDCCGDANGGTDRAPRRDRRHECQDGGVPSQGGGAEPCDGADDEGGEDGIDGGVAGGGGVRTNGDRAGDHRDRGYEQRPMSSCARPGGPNRRSGVGRGGRDAGAVLAAVVLAAVVAVPAGAAEEGAAEAQAEGAEEARRPRARPDRVGARCRRSSASSRSSHRRPRSHGPRVLGEPPPDSPHRVSRLVRLRAPCSGPRRGAIGNSGTSEASLLESVPIVTTLSSRPLAGLGRKLDGHSEWWHLGFG